MNVFGDVLLFFEYKSRVLREFGATCDWDENVMIYETLKVQLSSFASNIRVILIDADNDIRSQPLEKTI